MKYLAAQLETVQDAMPVGMMGTVRGVAGMTIEASDLALPIGSVCRIDGIGSRNARAEVIGFRHDHTLLMPLSSVAGVARGDRVASLPGAGRVWCSSQLLGRVLDGFGRPIDEKGPLPLSESRRIDAMAPRAMDRANIRQPIATSIRAIDALHTCGRGQRVAVLSGPGVGKSTLISSIAKNTDADVSVVALIGERGREVQEFLECSLGEQGLKRCVVIVSTGEQPPLLRVRAAKVACTIAEYFRDQGKHVMLMMDSLTRLCHAQRQIGLAACEPPATRGYPPSVFALLPQILERAGKTGAGSITGFYTVLVEGDDFNEPVSDAVRGVSDGHLLLTRALANHGHYPAIDVVASISRVRGNVCQPEQVRTAQRILSLLGTYKEIEDLVNIGAYVPGANLEYDLAVKSQPGILRFLQQDAGNACTLEGARKELTELMKEIEQMDKAIKSQAASKVGPRPASAK